MKNIFAQKENADMSVKKNVFDLSHRENLTLDFGKIYPLGQPIEVLPGDKVDLSLSAAMHAMPLVFPVQTPMTFKVFVFYVPNRLLCKKWEDYITGVYDDTQYKKPVHPYHRITSEAQFNAMLKTGGLLDYLGVPTTLVGSFAHSVHTEFEFSDAALDLDADNTLLTMPKLDDTPEDPDDPTGNRGIVSSNDYPYRGLVCTQRSQVKVYSFNFQSYAQLDHSVNDCYENSMLNSLITQYKLFNSLFQEGAQADFNLVSFSMHTKYDVRQSIAYVTKPISEPLSDKRLSVTDSKYMGLNDVTLRSVGAQFALLEETAIGSDEYVVSCFSDNSLDVLLASPSNPMPMVFEFNDDDFLAAISACCSQNRRYKLVFLWFGYNNGTHNLSFTPFMNIGNGNRMFGFGHNAVFTTNSSRPSDQDFTNASENPFYGATPKLALNCLPARAYECCCRSYFRNDKVNPFLDGNGEPIYNEYLRSTEDGPDDLVYDFYNANYELDAYTDCVPSPQFGQAPLVGLTITSGHTAKLHFDASNITGTSPQSTGGTLSADIEFTDDDNMTVTGINSYDHDMPSGNVRELMNAINYGISINDLRNVNALQRFKERMQLRSYRYKDQIYNHFGQKVSNVAVDMPQYIGGYNFDIQVNKINNTAAPSVEGQSPLGDYAGQASIFGKMSRNITHHCDEHGFILTVGYVVPRPVYTQLLPKVFSKTVDKFDYFTPEFGKIGYVPVSNSEVAPLQFAHYDVLHPDDEQFNGVFGYQKAWYDYMYMPDGAHNEFRISLSDYLAQRMFNSIPKLNSRFIQVYDEDINNIFSVENGSHFLGFVDYNLHIVRPIPRHAVPSIE